MNKPNQCTSRPEGARVRLRIYYTFLAVLLIGVTVVLILSMDSAAPGLFTLGMGSVTVAVTALIADTEEGTHALVRDGRLTKIERRVILLGFVCTFVPAITALIAVKIGSRAYESAILAVINATATGLFAFVALVRD